MLKNKYIKFLPLIILLILFIIFVKIQEKDLEVNLSETQINYEKGNFEDLLKRFEENQKASLIFSNRGDQKLALDNSSKSLSIWRMIYSEFKTSPPIEYKETINWPKRLELIFESCINSNNLIRNNELGQAAESLDKIRRTVRDMREENNIKHLNDQLLYFYDSLSPVVLAKDKEESAPYLQELKINFLLLKELNISNKYNKKILEIEQAIAGIDKLIASDFKKAQTDLAFLFEELYLSVW